LSNHVLTDAQLSILEKGLKFCPTPGEPHMGNLRRDLDSFHRQLRLNVFFELRLVHLKPTAPGHQNISKNEKQAIQELNKNPHIIVKPADKGGATVIQNTTDYITEAHRQLSDTKFYLNLGEENKTEHHNIEIQKLIDQLVISGEIHPSVGSYLILQKPRTPQLYLLPKIHKGTFPTPGRPVVSANDSPTERISAFVDFFLNPLTKLSRSYIKDTTHLLQLLRESGNLPANTLLVTLDVTSLYTSIPNYEASVAVYKLLREHRDEEDKPANKNLVKMLDMVLKYNNFQFNGTNYLQVGGTAMGTRVAPSLANTFMDDFEHKHVLYMEEVHRRYTLHMDTR
jgi:hypothetical protein